MPDYGNGQIYMIWSPNTDKVYIGSTTQPLHKRFYEHWHCPYKHTSAHEVIDCGDAKIELVEDYPCASKTELNRREGQVIRERACVNRCVAGRTKKEYRQEKKDQIAEQMKVYRQEKKDQIAEQKKVYRQENKDQIAARSKEYRQEKKDQIAEQKKVYRQENKDQIAEQKKVYQQRPEVKSRRNELARQRRALKKESA